MYTAFIVSKKWKVPPNCNKNIWRFYVKLPTAFIEFVMIIKKSHKKSIKIICVRYTALLDLLEIKPSKKGANPGN